MQSQKQKLEEMRAKLLAIAAEQKAKKAAAQVQNQQEMAGIKLAAKDTQQELATVDTTSQTITTVDTPAALESANTAVEEKRAAVPELEPVVEAPKVRKRFDVDLNVDQLRAVELAKTGAEFCLIGAAGTGKTTTIKAVVQALRIKIREELRLSEEASLYPYIALVSFTNRAVRNIMKAVEDVDGSGLCRTIHKLLQFEPTPYSYENEEGMMVNSMRFMPQFDASNPITTMKLIVVEESSMVSVDLFKQLVDACPNAKFIFIGDLNQLPPVFGDAILGYKLAELPVVELTTVYRQALESPIIAFQHNYTLAGRIPSDTDMKKLTEMGKGLTFQPLLKDNTDPEVMCAAFADFFRRKFEAGEYDPLEDIILIPYNKLFGTLAVNKEIAQWLGDKRMAEVYEIVAGGEHHYLAVGDFVIYDKREYLIKDIKINHSFTGKMPRPQSTDLTRSGYYRNTNNIGKAMSDILDTQLENFDKLFDSAMLGTDITEIQNQASHIVTLESMESDTTAIVRTRGELNKMEFGYAITIHKSQGSEWRRVFMAMTNHHKVALKRELLYTGMTRAREELFIIYSGQTTAGKKNSSIATAIARQQIPGRTWQEKRDAFKGERTEQYKAKMAEEV